MERGIPGILFFEDLEHLFPDMHSENDVVGVGINSDLLFLRNVQATAATVFTLARPIEPERIWLYLHKEAGDPATTVHLSWTGGFPPYNLHREIFPDVVRDAPSVYQEELKGALDTTDLQAEGKLLFYTVEEFPY